MKRLLTIAFLFISLAANAKASEGSAIGLRLGNGYEISFQTPCADNRIEIDMGWCDHYTNVSGIFQWVMPLQSGFKWYAGAGADMGIYHGSDDYIDGLGASVLCDIGFEYTFDQIPLQLSLDFRPLVRLLPDIDPSGNFGLGIRYVFY